MDILHELQSHPLFSGFDPEALGEIVRAAVAVTYEPGDVCIRRGDQGEVFGVLVSGLLEAVRGYGGDRRQRLGLIHPGECLGEMSLLTGTATGATVVAVEKSEAIMFLQEAVGPVIAMNQDAIRFLSRTLASRLAPLADLPATPKPAEVRFSLGATCPMRILAISCRKHDMRYRYFDTTSETARAGGAVDGLDTDQAVHTCWGPGGKRQDTISPSTHASALAAVLGTLTDKKAGLLRSVSELSAIAHRVCHGGLMFDGPEIITDDVKDEIRRLSCLAPMENPFNLDGIEACEALADGVPQVAVFDTSFFLKMPAAAFRYALPKELATEAELRRFGSHGISHEGAAREACKFLDMHFDALEMVTCHLGTGASLTAIDHGRPIANTMGQTSLEGLVMSTRPGNIDPGLLLHLINDRGMDPKVLAERLYNESGMLGLSAISGDVQAVQKAAGAGEPRALLAMEVYCRAAHMYLGAYITLLGGVDAVVFTGGVGENAAGVRARICQGMDWMGIKLDEMRNRTLALAPGEVADISQGQSSARILVVGSNEEHTIALKAVRALAQKRVTDVIRSRHKSIPISPSAHHVHLTDEHVEVLFGQGQKLTWLADLSQPGQFACKERVSLLGPKGRIDRVRVLGPVRPETQVEIARTEEFKLGIDAPIRMSGDLEGTPGITLEGPEGQVVLERGVICAMRHIHMSPQDAMEFAVRDRDVVRIRTDGERSLVFGDVVVRVNVDYRLDMHIDTDEANAAELNVGASGYLDSIQERAST